MALLWLVEILKRKYSFKVHIAHVSHGLLKNPSKQYLRFVKKTAETLQLPFYAKVIHLRLLAKKNKRSLEEMGRIERYSFFEEIAKRVHANKIVTAHTLDDQAETVLLRLLRGSGLKGLAGIPYVRPQGKYELIRPLLAIEKYQLLLFLKANHIAFIHDKTNQNTAFTRNRIRHRLMPLLEKSYNPQIKSSLANLQSICSGIQNYLDEISDRAFKKCLVDACSKNELRLGLTRLRKFHPAIQREVLMKALNCLKGDLKKISYEHILTLCDMIQASNPAIKRHLPDSVLAVKGGDKLRLRLRSR